MLKRLFGIILLSTMTIGISACAQDTVNKGTEPSTQATNQQQQNADLSKEDTKNDATDSDGGKDKQSYARAEEAVYAAYSQADLGDQEKVQLILKQIAGIDWSVYNLVSQHKALDTIEYLYKHIQFIGSGDYANIFMATTNLDGASSESYAAIVGELFYRDKTNVINMLARLDDPERQESIVSSIAYKLSYKDLNQVKKEIKQWRSTEEHSTAENKVIDALLVRLDDPY